MTDMPASEVENVPESKAKNLDSAAHHPRITGTRILIISTILLAANWLVLATWNYFLGTQARLWQIIPPALTLTFVATTFLSLRYSNFWLRWAYRASVIWLGVLNFGFFAACAAWIFSAATVWLPFHLHQQLIGVTFFGMALLVSIYGLVNANWVRITRVTVKLPHLPMEWRGRNVALVTDLHLGNVRGRGYSRSIVAKLQRLQPDAVFISGDLFDGTKAKLEAFVAPWKEFSAPEGIYYVTGNHEEFTDRTKFIKAVTSAGIRVLHNEKVEVRGLQIAGVFDGEAQDPQLFRALLQQMELDRNRASLLLAHQPSNLAIPEEEGISLQLSGHTHGGQVWPWTRMASRVHGRFNRGLNRFGKLLVFTSMGAGTWGVPMRVGTRSEIVLLRLESTDF
ncbi:MAG TPA: metallophosphoesterase [Candidatus Acidoferrum sp.]|jgi:predicted MPP superfamily phosphohydrolase|nr:metallophosphoesterase [Candidatus Acidoferrum sp.]